MTSLTGTLPELQAAYAALDQYAQSQGIGIALADFGALRTQADTTKILGYRQDDFNAALSAGRIAPDTTLQQFRPIAPFGSSYHNYGAAFDVTIQSRPASMSANDALRVLASAAPSLGLRWGGLFTNPDPPHFELAIPIGDAQQRYRAYAASGQATSAFDLSSFLPGVTLGGPSVDDVTAAADAPDVYDAGDDAGDIALSGSAPTMNAPLLALGLVTLGVVAWALHRKFF